MTTLEFEDDVMASLGRKLDAFSAQLDDSERQALAGVLAAGWANIDDVKGFTYEEPEVETFQMGSLGVIFKAARGGTSCFERCRSAGSTTAQCIYYCGVINP